MAVFVWSLFTALTPMATWWSFEALIACRVLMGVGEGMSLPSVHAMMGAWFPEAERTRAVVFITSGQILGTVAALGSSQLVAYSWPTVFHLYGVAGFVWLLFGLRLGSDSPESHPSIDPRER